MSLNRCVMCGTPALPSYSVHCCAADRGYRLRCARCFNFEVRRKTGPGESDRVDLTPIRLLDAQMQVHAFHINARLLGDALSFDARELDDQLATGYQFQVLASAEADAFALLNELLDKMIRLLSATHPHTVSGGLQAAVQTVRTKTEWDGADASQSPRMFVDGRQIDEHELQRMLTALR